MALRSLASARLFATASYVSLSLLSALSRSGSLPASPPPSRPDLHCSCGSPLSTNHHKVVVVGAGSAGVSVANMLYNRFADEGRQLTNGDIALVDVRGLLPCFLSFGMQLTEGPLPPAFSFPGRRLPQLPTRVDARRLGSRSEGRPPPTSAFPHPFAPPPTLLQRRFLLTLFQLPHPRFRLQAHLRLSHRLPGTPNQLRCH